MTSVLKNLLTSLVLGLALTTIIFALSAAGTTLARVACVWSGVSSNADPLSSFVAALFFSLWFVLTWFAYKEG